MLVRTDQHFIIVFPVYKYHSCFFFSGQTHKPKQKDMGSQM